MKKTNNMGHYVVNTFLNQRSIFFELFLVAFLLAFGTNLLTNYLFELNDISKLTWLCIGLALIFIPLSVLFAKKFRSMKCKVVFPCVLIFNKQTKQLVNIPGYDFGEEIPKILSSTFLEKKALKLNWEKDSLNMVSPNNQNNQQINSKKLLLEAIEYYLLENLSAHLSDFFANKKGYKLCIYNRDNISDLRKNRILDLFTTPTDEREAFINEDGSKKILKIIKCTDKEQVLHMAFCNGAVYRRFELTLPQDSVTTRKDDGIITISTPMIEIEFRIIFDGFSTTLPELFDRYYLKVNNGNLITHYYVEIQVFVRFKRRSLFSIGWEYHAWIDSFLNSLSMKVNKDEFLEEIGWKKVETLLHIMREQNTPVVSTENTKSGKEK
ncbi:hypothetical protein GTO89_11110 [Heliobacterium gestii]|uniref:DUF3137 domain-containing protein n=1 Tax=Heliomicrobium gestii TaxID=2699 RepID=A0A845LFA3_HELGE|nr:hypothetical protein [Heliomicrobium gestii]MBM7866995.1 hypothetical protein [Heliomicrobium gestii]MZP43590.1 hypothetical protein [Heliomicrobium gestii]